MITFAMAKLNHRSDTLRKIDARAKSLRELNKLSKEYFEAPKIASPSDEVVFLVWEELGITSDFHSRKRIFQDLRRPESSMNFERLEKNLRAHVRELTKYERILREAADRAMTDAIPIRFSSMDTTTATKEAVEDFIFDMLELRLSGRALKGDERKELNTYGNIFGAFPTLRQIWDDAKSTVSELLDESGQV